MALPAPNLDDRRFQDLVDEAKSRVQQHCPEWTDHNVSDPGVTLIETFAAMVEQLLYRLNRVPDLHYLRFLELIGVRLFPPTAARCDVTFWLSAARETPVVVAAGSQVASERTDTEDPVVFTVERALSIVPASLTYLATSIAPPVAATSSVQSVTGVSLADAGTPPVERLDELLGGAAVECFGSAPRPGDALLFGLSDAVPGCAVLLRIECEVRGVGVDPRDPPLIWEARDGSGWMRCEVEQDSTGGLNQAGDVIVHVPETHAATVIARQRAGWLRCRVTEPEPGQPFYQYSPIMHAVTASTIGGTVGAVHADVVRDEVIGMSDGVPGQRFPLARRPVVADATGLVIEVSGDDGWERWQEVGSFAESGPADNHVVLDRVDGEVLFGPAIRQPTGEFRYYGAVPAKGATIRVPGYRTGGGLRGNVARGVLRVRRDPVPFVSSVVNRRPATGGVDGESVRDASVRGPLLLRTRDRAVTAEDYEQLAREAAPEAARVRCVPADGAAEGARVLVVPSVPGGGELRFADLDVHPGVRRRIERYLDERRCLGARISVEPPFYQGVTVVAELRARPHVARELLRSRAVDALYAYFSPVSGGPDGQGWPFGRAVVSGEVFAVLQRLHGVDAVADIRLFGSNPTDPASRDRGEPVQRIDLPSNALVFSVAHQVRVIMGDR
ncbi:MAG TPA: putative baseplate assembly protein [Pseudonocardiaceae bacterium]|jgi:predicted phage baseplate assembly protein|nr:putative baseplate assembly protein [Pseudonocardiaceae bacterium]